MTKDEEVRAVVDELEAKLAQLREVTEQLTAIITAPPPPAGRAQEVPSL